MWYGCSKYNYIFHFKILFYKSLQCTTCNRESVIPAIPCASSSRDPPTPKSHQTTPETFSGVTYTCTLELWAPQLILSKSEMQTVTRTTTGHPVGPTHVPQIQRANQI